ncbi:hypothetical protein TCAL_11996 [Tigriopus californicus]|uniref:MutL C-terminal dimerisation domain-containing protein n=1 Tax=Tigriopus californicus TaxID=6832 RepID=A0A553P763_TIGCA|nr:hypothetical protein TCAL_11996 [Tigriopus californicus]
MQQADPSQQQQASGSSNAPPDRNGRILPLSQSDRSKLRSGVALVSPANAVEELVQNALDAGASQILVKVDLACFKIRVFDDGRGIPGKDLSIIASRYHTSKCHGRFDLERGLKYFGYRGEALASFRDMSALLQIVSKYQDGPTLVANFVKGKRKMVEPYFRPQKSSGTIVSVMDFMYNMPVRRNLISGSIDLEDIRLTMVGLALSHPRVQLTLENEVGGQIIFDTPPKTCLVSKFTDILGRKWSESLKEIQVKKHANCNSQMIKLSGIIGTEGALSKSKQFLFVNRRLLKKTTLHKIVNQIFKKSVMCRPNLASKISKSPRKRHLDSPARSSLPLHGVFCLFLDVPQDSYDITLEPQKTSIEFKDWDPIQNFIQSELLQFFRSQFLMPLDSLIQNRDPTVTSNCQPSIDFNISGIDFLNSQIQSVTSEESPKIPDDGSNDSEEEPSDGEKDLEQNEPMDISEKPFPPFGSSLVNARHSFPVKKSKTDHAFKTPKKIDQPSISQELDDLPICRSRILPVGKTPFLKKTRRKSAEKVPECSSIMACKWSSEAERISDMKSGPKSDIHQVLERWRNPQLALPTQSFRFERSMFESLTVLGQVDKKFIAGTIFDENDASTKLILYDQHAVHERIRLEMILSDQYPDKATVLSEDLSEPIQLALGEEERRILHSLPNPLRKFGLQVEIPIEEVAHVRVLSAPKCFLKREANELRNRRPSPLKDLIAMLLKDIALTGRTNPGSLNMLPKTIHNVFCSQACRSAIKFGQSLTLEDCQRLLQGLKTCQVPFQCAHGRPSFSILMDLSQLSQLDVVPNKKINMSKLHALMHDFSDNKGQE